MTTPSAENQQPEASTDGEQKPHWRVAPLLARLKAAAIDAVVVSVVGFFVGVIFIVAGLWADDYVGEGISSSGALAMWLTATIYLGLLESRSGAKNGQTLGKRSTGLRTVRARGGLPVGRARSWARAALLGLVLPLGMPLDRLAAFGFEIGPLTGQGIFGFAAGLFVAVAAAGRLRRAPHDWLSGTAVVEALIVDPGAAHRGSDDARGAAEGRRTLAERSADAVPEPLSPMPLVGDAPDRAAAVLALVVAGLGMIDAITPPPG